MIPRDKCSGGLLSEGVALLSVATACDFEGHTLGWKRECTLERLVHGFTRLEVTATARLCQVRRGIGRGRLGERREKFEVALIPMELFLVFWFGFAA